ncbi:hypothetical protein LB505_013584 [Fusarium chuoi]|nr:hypothetical protein LB505_013584 [Fusarium chuoi]
MIELVDLLILSCDEDLWCTDTNIHHSLLSYRPTSHNPFSVFSSKPETAISLRCSLSPRLSQGLEALPQSLNPITSPLPDERFLFHHYVTHVAYMMLPYEHPYNP